MRSDLNDAEKAMFLLYYSGHGLQMISSENRDNAGSHSGSLPSNFFICRDTPMIPGAVVESVWKEEALAQRTAGKESDEAMDAKYRYFEEKAVRVDEDIFAPINDVMKKIEEDCRWRERWGGGGRAREAER